MGSSTRRSSSLLTDEAETGDEDDRDTPELFLPAYDASVRLGLVAERLPLLVDKVAAAC